MGTAHPSCERIKLKLGIDLNKACNFALAIYPVKVYIVQVYIKHSNYQCYYTREYVVALVLGASPAQVT